MSQVKSNHLKFLKDNIYKLDSKWPQFKILFQALEDDASFIISCENVLIMERCYFYGGFSLFKPLFDNKNITVVDCINESTFVRNGGQEAWVNHPDFIKSKCNFQSDMHDLSEKLDKQFDFIFIPNIVHHIQDQYQLFEQISKILKPNGRILIFEGLVRELHHLPADYLRYTPFGIEHMLSRNGIKMTSHKYGSGVFDVISYVMQMALEYFPEDERKKYNELYEGFLYPYLQELDAKYPRNLQKPDKHFPMSYVVWGRK